MEVILKRIILVIIAVIPTISFAQFKDIENSEENWSFLNQIRFNRVYEAGLENEGIMKELFCNEGLNYPPKYIYWRAFKVEKELELWAKDSAQQPYKLIKTYPIAKLSGDLGPKRKQGDYQVPEGFYKVIKFNPLSSYWLSFKINYPNQSDSILGFKKKLGGDIFIHGDTVTIGCLPMTDSLIKEIYWITMLNQNELDSANNSIPFHIFPIRLTNEKWQFLYQEYWGAQDKITFWNSLQGVYNYFEDSHTIPKIKVDDKGYYKVIYPERKQTTDNGLSNSRTGQSGN